MYEQFQADTCSPIRNSPSTAENATPGVDQEKVLASTSVTEKVSEGNPEEVIRNYGDSGVNIQASLNKVNKLSSRLFQIDPSKPDASLFSWVKAYCFGSKMPIWKITGL